MKLVPTFKREVLLEPYMKAIRKRVDNCMQKSTMRAKERENTSEFW